MNAPKPRILLIEDQHFTRELIAASLRERGYDVTECHYQSQAEPLIKDRNSFDLILLDGYTDYFRDVAAGTRAEDNISDAETFLKDGRNHGIPVILISASRALCVQLMRDFPQSVVDAYDKSRLDDYHPDAELHKLAGYVERALRPRPAQGNDISR